MRPSTGCVTCIKRKCDEERPICRRCVKAKRECGGYRIPKTSPSNVTAVFPSDQLTVHSPSQPSIKYDGYPSEDEFIFAPALVEYGCLDSQPLETKALCCFFEHFVWVQKPFSFFLDYLPRIYQQASPESGLATIARAVSFAFLANKTQDHGLEVIARKEYGHALASVNRCLGSLSTPVNDQMMLSMLLLILFENFNVTEASPDKFLTAWVAHLGGSSLAIRQRGPRQLKTEVGKAMFRMQLIKMIIYAMLQAEPLPKFAETWARQSQPDPNDLGVQLLTTVRKTSITFKKAKILISAIADTDAVSAQHHLRMQQLDELSDHVEAMVKLEETYEALIRSAQQSDLSATAEDAWVGCNLSTFYACRLVQSRIIEICARKLAMVGSYSPATSMEPLRIAEILDHARYTQANMLRSIIRFVTQSIILTTRFPDPPVASRVSPLASFLNLWPVFTALHGTPECTKEQRQWFNCILENFAHNEGLWIAKTFASQPYAALDDLATAAGI